MSPARPTRNLRDEQVTESAPDSLDAAFNLLADRQRRLILYYFQQTADDTATFEELVDYLLIHEADSHTDLADDAAIRECLHDTHLPRLAAAGIIEYEPYRRPIHYKRDAVLEHLLERAMGQELNPADR